MKPIVLALSAIVAVAFLGSCDRHEFSETKVLHEKYQEHGSQGAEHEGGEHKAAEGHGEAKKEH